MTKKEIQLLFEYDTWADLKLFEVIAALTKDQYKKDLHSSFGGIQGTLVHILSANRVWLYRWIGKEPEPLKIENFPAAEIVKKQWDTYLCEVSNFLQGLTEEKLQTPLQYTDFKGNIYAQPLCQQMQHKVNHSSYHRGQLVMMLRQLGIAVVSTDLITYIRQKEIHG
jgi:uncharacterized damage-inducible protein DinB